MIDLKGEARTSGERRRREGGNIFSNEIQVGIAIYFLVKENGAKSSRIHYYAIPDYVRGEGKTAFVRENSLADIQFSAIHPDKKGDWINQTTENWDKLLKIASKEAKAHANGKIDKAIFSNFEIGVVTARDEWATDFSAENLAKKMRHLSAIYHSRIHSTEYNDTVIKWSRNLRRNLERGIRESFSKQRIYKYLYRPFCKTYLYDSAVFLNDRGIAKEFLRDNIVILFSGPHSPKPFTALATDVISDFNSLSPAADGCRCLSFYHYTEDGARVENITDWALGQFQKRYKDKTIGKEAIFHYVYAVLHNPAYRTKYEQNLKREFPRIPFYKDFTQWAAWGKALMELHLNYESALPFALAREDLKAGEDAIIKPRLIARKTTGVIEVDTVTTLRGVPAEAWQYRLGTYSALEWVLERHKEKSPKDLTIRNKFNAYRFADYKEGVIQLLQRVCTVSVETMNIVGEMPET